MYTLCITTYTPVKSQGKPITVIAHWELKCKSIHDHFALIPNVVGRLLQKGHTDIHTFFFHFFSVTLSGSTYIWLLTKLATTKKSIRSHERVEF